MASDPHTGQPLRDPFAALLAATFITNLGDGLRLTALPLLATTLTSSPLLIAGITAAQFLPWTTFAPFGGIIVDRSDRRRLILVTQAWRSAIMAALVLAIVFDAVQIWHLFIVAFMITVGEILVDPSVVATVPALVTPEELDRANGRISTVEIVTNDFAGGPLGAATFALAPWLPFVLDSVSYLGSIAPFSRLPANQPSEIGQRGADERGQFGAGVRWIRTHPFLRPITAAMAVFHLGTAAAFSLLILLVTDVLDASEFAFGLVLAAAAGGATASSLIAARLVDRWSRRGVVSWAAAITGASVLAAGAVDETWQLIGVWAVNGASAGVLLTLGRGFVQRHTPNDVLGRAAIATRMITRTAFVVGALLAGVVATATSVRWAFAVAGALHLVGSLLIRRAFRHEPSPTTEPATSPPS